MRATLAGVAASLGIACTAAVAMVGVAASNTPYYATVGLNPVVMALTAIPGALTLGLIVALPTSAAMVWCVEAVASRVRAFDHPLAWMLAGILFASPTAYLFSTMQNGPEQFALVSLWSFFLLVGAVSALAAWAFRYEKLR